MPDDSYRSLNRALGALLEAAKVLRRSRDASLDELLPAVAESRYAILFADATGRYIAANPWGLKLTGYTLAELRRKHVWDLTENSAQGEFEPLWRAFLTTGTQRGEYRLRRKSGRMTSVVYVAKAHVLKNVHASVIRRVDGRAPLGARRRNSRV